MMIAQVWQSTRQVGCTCRVPLSQYSSIIQQASRLALPEGALCAESHGRLLGASVLQCAIVRTMQGWRSRVVTRLVSARSSLPLISSALVSITCARNGPIEHAAHAVLHSRAFKRADNLEVVSRKPWGLSDLYTGGILGQKSGVCSAWCISQQPADKASKQAGKEPLPLGR